MESLECFGIGVLQFDKFAAFQGEENCTASHIIAGRVIDVSDPSRYEGTYLCATCCRSSYIAIGTDRVAKHHEGRIADLHTHRFELFPGDDYFSCLIAQVIFLPRKRLV